MNGKLLKGLTLAASIATAALGVASSYLAGKELDNKVAEKVSEALTKSTEN